MEVSAPVAISEPALQLHIFLLFFIVHLAIQFNMEQIRLKSDRRANLGYLAFQDWRQKRVLQTNQHLIWFQLEDLTVYLKAPIER